MIKLFFEHYVDPDPERGQELFNCFAENLRNRNFYTVTPLRGDPRLTMGAAVEEIRKRAKDDDISVLANADIAFDETIALLKNHDFKNTVLCLSRWHDGKLLHCNDAQDAWIFKGVPRPVKADFFFGVPGCDNRFAFELQQAGYSLSNPCETIKAHHRHTSRVRNYGVRLEGPIARVEPGKL